jgi:hypothetical protein
MELVAPLDVVFSPSTRIVAEAAWLFVRDTESVHITRGSLPDGGYLLLIEGPGEAETLHCFPHLVACVSEQMRIEHQLTAERFYLERLTSDRRRSQLPIARPERRRRSGPD